MFQDKTILCNLALFIGEANQCQYYRKVDLSALFGSM